MWSRKCCLFGGEPIQTGNVFLLVLCFCHVLQTDAFNVSALQNLRNNKQRKQASCHDEDRPVYQCWLKHTQVRPSLDMKKVMLNRFFLRQGHWLFEQYLNEIGTTELGAFFVVQVLLEHFIAHLLFS